MMLMKTRIALTSCLLAVAALILCGCAATQTGVARPKRFHEASHTDVVLQFSSWEYTFLVRPRWEDNGFLRQVHRESINQVFEQLNVHRDLAVVVIGWNFANQDMERLVAEWKTVLGGCGFRRVVFLRTNAYNELNGSSIIDDSTLSLASAQVPQSFPGPGQ
jgi:hypothetical protein